MSIQEQINELKLHHSQQQADIQKQLTKCEETLAISKRFLMEFIGTPNKEFIDYYFDNIIQTSQRIERLKNAKYTELHTFKKSIQNLIK